MIGEFPGLLLLSKAVFGCALLAIVFSLAVIDCRQLILPNRLNGLLAAGGLTQALVLGIPDLLDAAFGAVLGFVVLSFVARLFRHMRGIEGLGFGDQKFSAAAGLWIGWQSIAPMLLIASCSALVFVLAKSVGQQRFERAAPLPFGPFLGLGTIACWLHGVALGA